MKVSVIISVCDNRELLFQRSLDTWAKQTLPKEDWEFVVVDDADRIGFRKLCEEASETYGFNFQYIRIDNSKSVMPIKTFIPVLSSNVGFRHARGEVVVVTGPETLQAPNNLKIAHTFKDRKEAGFGLVFKSDVNFVKNMDSDWDRYKDLDFNRILQVQGARASCLTRPPHPPAYMYFMACAKQHIESVGGFDERFAAGFCAEDDDIASRLQMNGIEPIFEHKIVGIHQDHSRENSAEHIRMRKTPEGIRLREKNKILLQQNRLHRKIVANVMTETNPIFSDNRTIPFDPEYKWGDPRVIVKRYDYSPKTP